MTVDLFSDYTMTIDGKAATVGNGVMVALAIAWYIRDVLLLIYVSALIAMPFVISTSPASATITASTSRCSVAVSLFVSFTLDPMLSSVWRDPPGSRFSRVPWLGRFMDRVELVPEQ